MALTIGDLGRATATKVETIRYYERIGLLARPGRSAGNYRLYARADLDRLAFIRRARDLGFTLDRVRDLLALADDRTGDCARIDRIAGDHLAEVDRKLADLSALRGELNAIVDACAGGSVDSCRIIAALGSAQPSEPR